MSRSKVLFWNVDTQVDFVEPHGKLYVQGAEKLKSIWAKITNFAAEHKIRVINTCDFHHINSRSIALPELQGHRLSKKPVPHRP